MTQPSVSQHPASMDSYIRHGWSLVPIPAGTKGPAHRGWNLRTSALTLESTLPPGYGIGLAHAYSGTMALDIDSWDRAAFELMLHGINLQALYDAPDAVIIDSGRQGHGKLLYAMPLGLALPSKKVSIDGTTVYELRCSTAGGLTVQDVLPPSIHPQTNQPYRWAGSGHWTRLPIIPQPLLDLWQSLLTLERPVDTPTSTVVEWDLIEPATGAIDPDVSREEWITVGMALHYAGTASGEVERAYNLWNSWSQKSTTKYPGEREMLQQWASFRTSKPTSVKLGSLFKLAREAGWSKPVPDIGTLFSAVEPLQDVATMSDIRVPPPGLNLDLVPRVLRTRAQEIGEHVGCDPMVPLFAGMAAVCGALDARMRLELKPGFKVPPVLWIMSIGEPGDKKTPGSKPMFDILHQLEREDTPRYAKAATDFEVSEARYVAAKKHLLDMATSPDMLLSNAALPALPQDPKAPVPLKVLVQDTTSQKLVRSAAERPRGLLCYLDEMASWVKKVCDPRSGEDRSAWTVAYEANRYEMDRVGSGTTLAENYAVAMFGNLQPRVLRENIAKLTEDGLVQRFIPVALRPECTKLGHPVPECMTNAAEYEQMVRVCFGLPAMTYRLSPGAYDTFYAFQVWYNQAMRDERLLRGSDTLQTAMGKLEGLCGRLALVWHCIESPYTMEVSGALMGRVVQFVKGYVLPALRYCWDGELTESDSLDRWVAEHVLYNADVGQLTLSQIRRSARRRVEKYNVQTANQMVIGAMEILEASKWVARVDDKTEEGRGVALWVINPALKEMFASRRQAIMDAKRRAEERRHEVAGVELKQSRVKVA